MPMALASSRPLFGPPPVDHSFRFASLSHRPHPVFNPDLNYPIQSLDNRTSPSPSSPFPPRPASYRWRSSCLKARASNGDDDHSVASNDNMDVAPSASRALEQGEKIRTLQKEILGQIMARKKLVSSLKENLGHVSEQMRVYDVKLKDYIEPNKQHLSTKNNPVLVSDTDISENKQFSGPQASDSEEDMGLLSQNSDVQTWSDSSIQMLNSSILEEPTNGSVTTNYCYNMSEESSTLPAGLNAMNVIIVAAECAPWSKTGGLGDVVAALPKALARRGHRVMVIAPRYSHYAEAKNTEVRKRYTVAGQDHEVCYFHGYIEGVDHVFVDNNVFHGVANDIYGGKWEDVLKRMVLLCKAAIEVPWLVPCGGVCYGDGNLVFIANDWHTALLPVYLQAYYRDNGLMQYTRSVLVIHNIAHQGRGPMSEFFLLGLPDHYREKFRLYDPIGGEHMNIFMAGVITAHRIVAVSHGYAWECQTQEGGWGLDGIMHNHNWKLRGVVNGIDDKEWSPELDVYLKSEGYENYSIDTLERGKSACKVALQKELGLPVRSDVPILGFIGRLDHQKGVDIIADAMHWIRDQDVQLILLGTGRPDLESMLRSFEDQSREKIRAWVGFSVKMAHRITAGCDILLMPSRFEPCGLNQLYAMRYGTIPVVHAVGGLRDTVQPFDPYSNTGTGWTFEKADPSAMIHALGNAIWTYRDFKDSWKALQRRGMSQDLSWDNAAKQYEEVLVAAKYQW